MKISKLFSTIIPTMRLRIHAAVLVGTLTFCASSAAKNPVPQIELPLNPSSITVGSAGLTLTVHGYGFTEGSEVKWNGSARTTTYISSHELTAAILAHDVESAGKGSISVANTTPRGGTSNVVYFPIGINKLSIGSTLLEADAGQGAFGIATGDFNGDGNVDIVTANTGGTVSILLGTGAGTFQTHVDYSAGADCGAVAVGDFNGDGFLDLVVVNKSANTVTILKGLGNGTFQTEGTYAVGTTPVKVAVADMNHAGNLDLVVADYGSSQISVLLGNGDLTFGPAINTTLSEAPVDVAIGDLDLDGIPDLAVAAQSSNYNGDLLSLRGNGDGTFQAPGTYSALYVPYSVALADVNQDGYPDAIVGEDFGVQYFQATTGARFKPGVIISGADYVQSFQLGDFNGDGFLDVAAINENGNPFQIDCAFGNNNGTFGNNGIITYNNFALSGNSPRTVAMADFNGDGQLDLAVTQSGRNGVDVLLQTPVTPSATLVTFATQLANTNSPTQQVMLYNSSGTPLNIGSIIADSPFSQTNDCGASLASQGTCSITVWFTPTAFNQFQGYLTITDGAVNSPQKTEMTGTGTLVGLTPTSYDFGTVAVGSSAQAMFTVTSVATHDVMVRSITAGGRENGREFSEANTCGSSIPPNSTCTITVTFAPTVAGSASGAVSVTTNSSPYGYSTLTGTGQ